MRIISLQKKLIVFISMILLSVFVVVSMIILPSVRHITELRKSINQTENYLEEQYLRSQQAQKSIRMLDEILLQTEKFQTITIEQSDELKVITELEKIAMENNIEQKLDVAFVEKDEDIGLPYYKFTFINQGFFEDQINYLRALELFPYYAIINSISWQNTQSRVMEEKNKVTTKFDAIIYATPNSK